jgi:rare lipoprotein A
VVADEPVTQTPIDQIPKVEPLAKYGNPKSYEVFGKTYYTLPSSKGFVERGIASWYGKKFHGRLTSSREPYDMYAMTAAHTQLPLPTYVQVTNLKNGKQVVLRVNDRGPFHGNRVIDLSYTAAKKLDIIQQGTGLVEVRALDPRDYQQASSHAQAQEQSQVVTHNEASKEAGNEDNSSVKNLESTVVSENITHKKMASTEDAAIMVSADGPKVYVQVGAFGERENADQLKNQLSTLNLGNVSISSVMQNSKQLHRVRIGPLSTVESADDTVSELDAMGMNNHRMVIE